MKLTLPKGPTARGVHLDRAAIREAIEFLGIEGTVVVKWTNSKNYAGSCTSYIWNEHHIHLSSYGGKGTTGATLWHELTHAMQCERHGWVEFQEISAEACNYSDERYWKAPHEMEARDMESFNSELPLARWDARREAVLMSIEASA